MPRKNSTAVSTPNSSLYADLAALLSELQPKPPSKSPQPRRPGRPSSQRAETVPVILHLYKSHVHWLDNYASVIQSLRPGNAHLSRVEIVRGLLLGLADFALERDMEFAADIPVTDERSFQKAISESLHRAHKTPRRPSRK